MAALNASPDSFYAASRASVESIRSRARQAVAEGAAVLDIGGESTRPGAAEISPALEIERVIPLIRAVREEAPGAAISVDTRKASVARAALEAGADWVNDVSALRHDPAMADLVAQSGAPVVLMHMRGTPETMQKDPRYEDVVAEIAAFFDERLEAARRAGIAENRIILDPGIGFGKTVGHNLEILRRLEELKRFGRPVLIGASRKAFIGKILASSPSPFGAATPMPAPPGRGTDKGGSDDPAGHPSPSGRWDEATPLPPEERLEGTLAVHLWAAAHGADGLRVHDVAAARRALRLWRAIAGS